MNGQPVAEQSTSSVPIFEGRTDPGLINSFLSTLTSHPDESTLRRLSASVGLSPCPLTPQMLLSAVESFGTPSTSSFTLPMPQTEPIASSMISFNASSQAYVTAMKEEAPTRMDSRVSSNYNSNGLSQSPDVEPSTSQADQGSNSKAQHQQMPVPRCAICAADSTGIHFGCEACAACSAFFRRTVVLNKVYNCSKQRSCVVAKDSSSGQKCRACRFAKCLQVGMDRTAVQHRRDAIGRFSDVAVSGTENDGELEDTPTPMKAVKRECESPLLPAYVNSDTTPSVGCLSPPSPKSPKFSQRNNVLDEFLAQHDNLVRRRKLFYTSGCIDELFTLHSEMDPVELTNFNDCMYQLWRIEPRLCAEFIASNSFFTKFTAEEKTKMLKNFLLLFQAVEEPYLTWKYGGLENGRWIMPNRVYIDFARVDHYYETMIMDKLNLDKKTAMKIFLPSFQHAMDTIGEHMKILNISHTEMVAIAGMLLLDPWLDVSDQTRRCIKNLRNQLLKDIMTHYENEPPLESPEVRLGNLILMLSSIKVHARKCLENMQMLKIFDIVPRDQLFDEMFLRGPEVLRAPSFSEWEAQGTSSQI